MRQTRCPEERQVIYVAQGERVTLIEVRAGSVGFKVIGIWKSKVAARGRVIDRMAKGIGQIKQQGPYRLA
jgi:hypothetical protein